MTNGFDVRRTNVVVLCVTMLLLIATACGSPTPAPTSTAVPASPTPTPTTPPSPTSTATPQPTSTPEPTPQPAASPTPLPSPTPTFAPISEAKTLTMATWADPPHFDVHQTISAALHRTGPGLAYSRLLRFRTDEQAGPFNLLLECDLCESWEQVGPVTYRFTLREDARWQDMDPLNGRPLTPDDIIYSYRRQATSGWPNAGLLRNLRGIRKLDGRTLELEARSPDADFLRNLAEGHSKIVAPEAVETTGHLRDGPTVGTGPWELVRARENTEYLLERNPLYYEEGIPGADRLRVKVIPEARTRFAALLVGQLDLSDVPPSRVSSLADRSSLKSLQVPRYSQGIELVLKADKPPFQDQDMRRAVFQALDPWRYAGEVWPAGQGAFAGLGMPLVDRSWLLPEDELRTYWGDPEGEQRLREQLPEGSRGYFVLTAADYGDPYLSLAQSVAGDLRAAGLEPEVRVVTPVEFVDRVWGEGDYTMYLGPSAPMTIPNDYLTSVLHSEGQSNTTGYKDPELDRLIEEQADELDPARRRSLVLQIQRRALQSAVRFSPVTQTSTWAWGPGPSNVHPNLAGSEYFYYARIRVPES